MLWSLHVQWAMCTLWTHRLCTGAALQMYALISQPLLVAITVAIVRANSFCSPLKVFILSILHPILRRKELLKILPFISDLTWIKVKTCCSRHGFLQHMDQNCLHSYGVIKFCTVITVANNCTAPLYDHCTKTLNLKIPFGIAEVGNYLLECHQTIVSIVFLL